MAAAKADVAPAQSCYPSTWRKKTESSILFKTGVPACAAIPSFLFAKGLSGRF